MTGDDFDMAARREELLARVRSRGQQIRRRRRALGGVGAAAAFLVAVPAVTALVGDGGRATLNAAGSPSTTSLVATAVADPFATSQPPATTTVPSTLPPSDAVALPSTFATPTTVGAPPTTGPKVMVTTVPAVSGPRGPYCEAKHFDAVLTMERAVYSLGEPVRFGATFTNVSGAACYYASVTSSVTVLGPDGEPLGPTFATIADLFEPVAAAPGEELTQQDEWDQRICEGSLPPLCAQAPPGAYEVVFERLPFGSATATFRISG